MPATAGGRTHCPRGSLGPAIAVTIILRTVASQRKTSPATGVAQKHPITEETWDGSGEGFGVANPKNERKGKDELAKELDRLASGKAPQPARTDDADHLSSD